MPDIEDAEAQRFSSPADEIERVVHSATIWLAAGMVAPGVVLGPLLAAGWRPAALPIGAAIPFWAGTAVAALGIALLIWAGCPVLRAALERADRRKMNAIRIGIPMEVAGMAIALLALLLSPR
jgi:hypothetical protein